MLKRITLIILSLVIVTSVVVLSLRTVARLEGQRLGARLQGLVDDARTLEARLMYLDAGLTEIATKWATSGLALELKQYEVAKEALGRVALAPPALGDRVADLEAKLQQRAREFHAAEPSLSALAIVGEENAVLVSESPLLPVGATAVAPREELEGRPRVALAPEVSALVGQAMIGVTGSTVVLLDGGIYGLAAAPVMHKGKIAGVVVVEKRLVELPASFSSSAFVVSGGRVILGEAPPAYDVAGKIVDRLQLLVRQEVTAPFFASGLEASAAELAREADKIGPGLWGRRFSIGTLVNVDGVVVKSMTGIYEETVSLQRFVLALGALLFLLQAALLLFAVGRVPAALEGPSVPAASEHESRLDLLTPPGGFSLPPEAELSFAPVEAATGDDSSIGPFDDFADDERTPPPKGGFTDADAETRVAQIMVNSDGSVAIGGESSDKTLIVFAREEGPPGESIADEAEPAPKEPREVESVAAADAAEPEEEPAPLEAPKPPLLTKAPMPPPMSLQRPPPIPGDATVVVTGAVGAEAHYREVYEDFLRVRKENGENAELPFDKFAGRLSESRAAVVARHRCKDVTFQVYVKNGKAAIKATPVV